MHSLTRLRLLSAGAYSAARGQDYPPHRHTCWELVFYREGRIEVPIGDEVFLTHPGLLLLTPPGIVHAERALTAYSNYFIALEAPPHNSWPHLARDDARGSLSYLFRALVEENSDAQNGVPNEASHSLTSILLAQLDLILDRAQSVAPVPHGELLVREAERVFAESMAQAISVQSVAGRVGVAPSVLRAHFANFRGYSPSAALLRVRLRQALALLQSSDLSLKEIAQTCGFHSSSHLSRHVKAAVGTAPGQWRQPPQTP
ncbi:MAG TPA: helix-turn-helix domain-containing protein [Abditibacteriaceae bacterium]|jgi:AraC-like DNA-binding protein